MTGKRWERERERERKKKRKKKKKGNRVFRKDDIVQKNISCATIGETLMKKKTIVFHRFSVEGTMKIEKETRKWKSWREERTKKKRAGEKEDRKKELKPMHRARSLHCEAFDEYLWPEGSTAKPYSSNSMNSLQLEEAGQEREREREGEEKGKLRRRRERERERVKETESAKGSNANSINTRTFTFLQRTSVHRESFTSSTEKSFSHLFLTS